MMRPKNPSRSEHRHIVPYRALQGNGNVSGKGPFAKVWMTPEEWETNVTNREHAVGINSLRNRMGGSKAARRRSV